MEIRFFIGSEALCDPHFKPLPHIFVQVIKNVYLLSQSDSCALYGDLMWYHRDRAYRLASAF
jgi:hypothetical protein